MPWRIQREILGHGNQGGHAGRIVIRAIVNFTIDDPEMIINAL